MPLDGLSFSNSGLYKIVAPMEITTQVEKISKVQAETTIKKPEKKERLTPDTERDKDQQKDLQGRNTDDESQEKEENTSYLENEAGVKKYKVTFNKYTDMVELVDNKTGVIVEKISPDDLLGLISKAQKSSGILVDKEI